MQLWEKKRENHEERPRERQKKCKRQKEEGEKRPVEPICAFSLSSVSVPLPYPDRSPFSLVVSFPLEPATGGGVAPSVKPATGFYSRMSIFRQLEPTLHATKAPTHSLRCWRERKKGRKARQRCPWFVRCRVWERMQRGETGKSTGANATPSGKPNTKRIKSPFIKASWRVLQNSLRRFYRKSITLRAQFCFLSTLLSKIFFHPISAFWETYEK